MKPVMKLDEAQKWIGDEGKYRRTFGLLFDPVVTPTAKMACGTSTLPPGNEQPGVSHHNEGEEIYFILSGKGDFLLDDDWFEVESGSVIYVAPGAGHRCKNTGNEDLVMFWVNCPSVLGATLELMKSWEKID